VFVKVLPELEENAGCLVPKQNIKDDFDVLLWSVEGLYMTLHATYLLRRSIDGSEGRALPIPLERPSVVPLAARLVYALSELRALSWHDPPPTLIVGRSRLARFPSTLTALTLAHSVRLRRSRKVCGGVVDVVAQVLFDFNLRSARDVP
jgi:hypothetical protein